MRHAVVKLALSGLLILSGCDQASERGTETSDSGSDSALQTDPTENPSPSANGTASPSPESQSDTGSVMELDGITLNAPANWASKPPASPLIAAEYVLPRADGDDTDGRLTISTAGGTVEANIDRWKGQFDPPPQDSLPEEIVVAGLQVTIVDYSGDFDDQRGPFAPEVKRPNYRMIAAVITVDGQLHFIKATGPQKTIAANADAIHAFIRSAKSQ